MNLVKKRTVTCTFSCGSKVPERDGGSFWDYAFPPFSPLFYASATLWFDSGIDLVIRLPQRAKMHTPGVWSYCFQVRI